MNSEDIHNLKQELDMYTDYQSPPALIDTPIDIQPGSHITHNTKKPTKCDKYYTNKVAKNRKKNKNKKTHRK